MEFSIIGPGSDELNLLKQLPESFKGKLLFQSEAYTASAAFGEFVFQHFVGDDFDIWFSNYMLAHATTVRGRGDEPLLELHIQFENSFDINWDGYGKSTLHAYQYNLSYTPFINTEAAFLSGKRYQTFDIVFKQKFLEEFAPSCGTLMKFLEQVNKKQPGSISPVDRFLTPQMIHIIDSILRCDFSDKLNRIYIECKVQELLILILDHIDTGTTTSKFKLNSYDIECLKEAERLILLNFEDKTSLKDLARKSGVNEFKLKKGFKYLFGNTVYGYRNAVRMEKAKIILEETALPIHDLAFMMGFDHTENFQKAFKKYWGYTPAELRKTLNK